MAGKARSAGTYLMGDLTVNRMGYGAMQLAGPGIFGPPKDREACVAVLRAAVGEGVNHIDTSDFYGPEITNQIIREALSPYPEDLVIVTKVGAERDAQGGWPPARRPDQLRAQVEGNLRNLGLEAMDVVNLRVGGGEDGHSPVPGSIAEPFGALAEMRKEGKIKHLGVSTVNAEQVAEAQSIAPVVCVQNFYNIAGRGDDKLVDDLAAQGIAYVPYFPLGGFRPLQDETLEAVAGRLGAPKMTVALAWLLQRSPNLLLIPGTSSVDHLRENLAAVELRIPAEELSVLNGIGGWGSARTGGAPVTDAKPTLVGFVGVGNMGGRMTRRLVAAGHEVLAVDAVPERVTDCGARPAASLADLSARCDVILLSLPDSFVIEQVIRGGEGLLASARDGQVIVDLSTADPKSTRSLHDDLAAKGAQLLDAGISGGATAADKGTLTLMVGGDAAALDRVRPLLGAFAASVHHMGRSGAGHVTKILNNFLNGVTLAATAEVMVAGRKAGLDLAQLLEVINTSSGVSYASLNRFPRIISGDYLEGGLTGKLMAKDVRLYLDLARDLALPTLVGPGTLTAFEVSNALGYGDVISNRVVDAFGDLAGGVRVSDG